MTIADNIGGTGGIGGFGIAVAARAQVAGSILARNTVASATVNCGAVKPTDGGNDVEDETDCALAVGGGLDPKLATKLSSEGGELDVLAIGSGSPAVDRLPVATNCTAGTLDQRNLYRPQGAACDSGAYELDQAATMTINGGPTGTISTDSVQFDFSSSEPGVNPVCQLTGPGQAGGYTACYKSNAQPYSGLANGAYTFSVRDGAFPSSTPATRAFTVAALDTTITAFPPEPTNDTTPTFSFTGVNGASSFQCRVDTAAFATCVSPFTTAALAAGTHTFEVRALSAAGAPDPTPASRTFTIDTTAPNTTITSGPSGTVPSASAAFTYTSSEAGSTFQCQLDSAGFGACPAGYTGLSQGAHTFQVRAIDAAGNVDATPATQTWTVDTTPPETTITGGPTGTIASASASFTYTSSEGGSTFQCQLDGGGFGACPASYTGLGQGLHTFQVRATDAVGNTDATPASRSWTVDTVAPDTALSPIASPGNDNTPTFNFGSEAGATFKCRVDAAAFATCASPQTTAALSDGTHSFDVVAVDAAGNTDPSPATQTFVIDTTAPNTTITAGPETPGNDNTPTFTFTSSEGGASFQCRVDGAAFTACPSPFTTAALSDAGHTFDVRAIDAAGNVDGTPASQTFVIDTTAPNTDITGGPGAATNDTTPTFTFTGTGGAASFECRVDSGGFTACVSPFTPAALPVGSHTVSVRALSAAGTPDPSPATRTFVVDLTGPAAPAFTSPADNALLATSTVRLDGTAEAGSTVDITEGATARGSAVVSGTGTWTVVVSSVADGTHVYTATATDTAGNRGPSASRTVRVDTVAPDTTITTGPSGATANPAPTFAFTSTEAGTFECSVDGAVFAACPTPFTTPTLGAGTHTFDVRAVDAAGNRDASPARRSITVDTTAPDTALTPVTTPGTDSTPTFTFSSEANATFQCRIDGAAYAACPSPFTTTNLLDGTHTFDVRAVDAAGNPDPTPATQTFVIDTTAPTTTLAPISSPTNDTTPSFTFTSNEAATFQCRVDGAAFAACVSGFTAATLAQGPHTVDVRAIDAAGNVDATPATQTFTVDTTAPDTTLTPVTTPSNDSTPTFTFTSSESGTFECRIDGAAFAACTSPLTTAVLPDGVHTFAVRARDAAGNLDTSPDAQTFLIDTGAPNTTIDTGPGDVTNDATPSFTFSADEAGTFECRIDAADFAACTSPLTTPALPDGEHTFQVRALDDQGNTDGTPASRTFTVDTTPPAAPDVVSGPDGPTTNSSPEFAFAAADATSTACRLDGPGGVAGEFGACTSPKAFNALAPGDYVFFVRSVDAAGNAQTSQRAFTVTVPQQATPTPTPRPAVTPTPTPTVPPPVANQSVDIKPVSGTVLIKLPGSKIFVKLSPSLIKNGAEVDARNGVVEITRSDGGVAKFYDGIFKLSHSGGYTVLTLTEKLTGCPKAKKSSASAAAKKPKTRKLWGDGKGKFRTKGQYSAATVRGTKWLVTDTCTTTVTKVATGVVEVQDLVKKKKLLVRAPKSYTARAEEEVASRLRHPRRS